MREWHLNVYLIKYYDLIEEVKIVETRSPDPTSENDYGKISKEDILFFHPLNSFSLRIEGEKLKFKAGDIRKYNSVEEMLKHEDINSIFSGINSTEEAVKIYNSFPGYKERIKKYGIVAIDLLKID